MKTLFITMAPFILSGCFAANSVKNASFEDDASQEASRVVTKLSGWEVYKGSVEIVTDRSVPAAEGKQALDLNGTEPGGIRQTIRGLKKNRDYTLKLAYGDRKERGRTPSILLTTEVFANGEKLTTLRNKSIAPEYVDGIGFAVRSTSKGTLELAFESTVPGVNGMIIDNLRLEEGKPLAPPRSREIVNGSFEMPIDSESDNPHIHGTQLPGWLIVRENIDIISYERFGAPDGKAVVDLGGHGPGGIAQTVIGLEPGAKYRLSMEYARHQSWNMVEDLTGEIFLDDKLVLSLSRSQRPEDVAPNWVKIHHDFVAPKDGEVTLSMFSTSLTVGGGILYDDIRIEKLETAKN